MRKIFFIFLITLFGATIFFSLPQTTKAQVIITFETLPAATEGDSYFYKLKAEGGQEPYVWGTPYAPGCVALAPTGALPLASKYGFSLSPKGEISAQVVAIPQKQNLVLPIKHDFYVGAKDNKGTCAASRKFTIEINAAGETPQTTSVQITSKSPLEPGATKNKPYQYQFSAAGGSPAGEYEWFFEDQGSLAKFNPSLSRGGLLAVAPTEAGSYQFRIWVRNKLNILQKDTATFSLLVSSGESLQISSPSDGIVGQEYSQILYISGGIPPYDPQIEEKPSWLTYNVATGSRNEIYLRGTPPNEGIFSLKIKVADSSSPQESVGKSFGIKIGAVGAPMSGKVLRDNSKCPTTGLVPCGTEGCPCQFCDLFVMSNNILEQIFKWVVPTIAVLMLMIGGLLFLFSGAKPDLFNQSKGTITAAIIGLLIIFGAWVIVNTVFEKIGVIDMPAGWKWYDIGCAVPGGYTPTPTAPTPPPPPREEEEPIPPLPPLPPAFPGS